MVVEFIAEGFEELEAVAPLDLLRRAGVAVQTAGLGGKTVTGRSGIALMCDCIAEELDVPDDLEGVILPGGPGHALLAESLVVQAFMRAANERNALLAAICAAPSVLGRFGYLNGKRACCYPGYEAALLGAAVSGELVVCDGNVITSRGAGTALEFALALVRYLISAEKEREIASQIQCP